MPQRNMASTVEQLGQLPGTIYSRFSTDYWKLPPKWKHAAYPVWVFDTSAWRRGT